MAAKAVVSTTAAASNETAIVANANIPTAHRPKRTHERHKNDSDGTCAGTVQAWHQHKPAWQTGARAEKYWKLYRNAC